MLEQGAALAQRSGREFQSFCDAKDSASRLAMIEQIRRTENEADLVTAQIYDALNKTFVTPIDRGDIHYLAGRLEEITDGVFDTVQQVIVHAMDDLPAGTADMASLIARCCDELAPAVSLLRTMNDPEAILRCSKNVAEICNRGGDLFRQHTSEIFRHKTDAVILLKHKEFLEGMSGVLRSTKQVVHSLENIFIKNA